MRILITGAFGQLGHALQSVLSKKSNYELICTGRKIKKGQKGIPLDIRNQVVLKELINTTSPDILINLAAQPGIRYSILNPHKYIDEPVQSDYGELPNQMLNQYLYERTRTDLRSVNQLNHGQKKSVYFNLLNTSF